MIKSANIKKGKGFTLIEVLIASFILFLVISTTTLIYRSALLSSHKAERSAYINGLFPIVVDEIERLIRNSNEVSTTTLAADEQRMGALNYSWTAEMIDFRAAPPKLIPETGTYIQQSKRFKQWQVEVKTEYKGYQREFRYIELSWQGGENE